ncbi:MAG: hypothetical protein MI808_23610 [Pseudomonadales bacterium]|nr:hypothetical protein [Pseudomonadales bacterium]
MTEDSDNPPSLACELPMVRVSRAEYVQLAQALGTTPLAKYLVMSNGVQVGWRSNRYCYVSPVAFKVATGQYPKGYRP